MLGPRIVVWGTPDFGANCQNIYNRLSETFQLDIQFFYHMLFYTFLKSTINLTTSYLFFFMTRHLTPFSLLQLSDIFTGYLTF